MKKIEMHCKTKYSTDKESTIDIETVLWNAKENKEPWKHRGGETTR